MNTDLLLHKLLGGVEVLLLVLLVNLGHSHVVKELVQQLHLSLLHLLQSQSLASVTIHLLVTEGLKKVLMRVYYIIYEAFDKSITC